MHNQPSNNKTINPNKTKSIRNLGAIDIAELKKEVLSISENVWENETLTRENNFKCFHDTQHIIFRFPDDTTKRTIVHTNPSWWVWESRIMPLIQKAVEPYGYEKGEVKAVMLAKLKAGQGIDNHIDGLAESYFLHKIHIPLKTNDQVKFFIKPNTYFLEEGIAYEVNNILPHYVVNEGKEDRIHLIFEYHNPGF